MPKNIVKNPHFLHPSIDTEHWPIEAADATSGRFPFCGTVEGPFQRNKHEPVGCWLHASFDEQELLPIQDVATDSAKDCQWKPISKRWMYSLALGDISSTTASKCPSPVSIIL
jgi:hypothetical protein